MLARQISQNLCVLVAGAASITRTYGSHSTVNRVHHTVRIYVLCFARPSQVGGKDTEGEERIEWRKADVQTGTRGFFKVKEAAQTSDSLSVPKCILSSGKKNQYD